MIIKNASLSLANRSRVKPGMTKNRPGAAEVRFGATVGQRLTKPHLILLGPPGSFSDEAADVLLQHGGRKTGIQWSKKYVRSFAEVLSYANRSRGQAAGRQNSIYALLPVKNKLLGEIKPVSAFLRKYKPKILYKLRLPIDFVLAAREEVAFVPHAAGKRLSTGGILEGLRDADLGYIEEIFCASLARKQCEKFIKTELSGAKINAKFPSTSSAYKKLVQLQGFRARVSAAIGSKYGAKVYGLKVIKSNIQDKAKDWTDFVVVKGRGKG